MTTALDIIKGALRDISVLAAGESPTAEESQDSLEALNLMIAAWELDGIAIGAQEWALSDVIQLPANHILAIRRNLAVRLAPEFGAAVSNITVQEAGDGYRSLQTAYGEPLDMDVDNAIRARRRYPSGRPY